jgi:uncharacterized protein YprB with RNaseH-like and TPR domain
MISDAIRKRLRRLNRAVVRARFPSAVPHKPGPPGTRAVPGAADTFMGAGEPLNGREVDSPGGKFLLIDRRASQVLRRGQDLVREYSYYFEGGAAVPEESASVDLVRFVQLGPRKSIFLDIETTGLGGSPLFLVGLLLYHGHELFLRQLFARDYSEEKPLLQYLLDLLGKFELVVTFNGKAFDIPYIKDRCSFNLLPYRLEFHHLDLLHEYRRRWRNILPDCRLLTLESRICCRDRVDDIPGRDIPGAYHDFVRTGDARQIKDILYHNALDLLTMSELVLRLFGSET